MKVSQADFDQFRERVVGRKVGEETYSEYLRWIKRFEQWYDGDEPTIIDLEDFDTMLSASTGDYPWENKRGRSPPDSYAYSSRVIALSAVKLWVRRQYGVDIPEKPQDIVIGEKPDFSPTYLDREEVREVIDGAEGDCDCFGCKAACALSYDAILRAAELCLLQVEDLDLRRGMLDVTAVKKSRDSTLSLGDYTVHILREYLEEEGRSSGPLFTNTYENSWNRNAWSTHFIRNHHPAGSHSFGRHTPILHMLDAGVPFGDVYRRARHRNPQTTAQYARIVGTQVPSWVSGGSPPDSGSQADGDGSETDSIIDKTVD